jgi:hypothetical protein
MVMVDAVVVVNVTFAVFLPETVTVLLIGELTISEFGMVKATMRAGPDGMIDVGVTVTGPPLPAGGVIVTVTLAAVIVPAGKPVPFTVTPFPGAPDEGVVVGSSTT